MSENPDDYLKKLRRDQGFMPMSGHLTELRSRLFRSLIWIALFAGIAYFFYSDLWNFILGPVGPLIQKSRLPGNPVVKIITTRLGDNFTIEIKILLLCGFILSFPAILFEIWGFIQPALDKKFRRYGNGLLLFALLLFWSGVIFARMVTWPSVVEFLIFQWTPPELAISATEKILPEVLLNIGDYFSFFMGFHIAFGLSFELPVVSIILGAMGIISSSLFIKFWRHAIVALCVFSILVMPPDLVAMFSLMVPLLVLYFLSFGLVWLIEKK